MTNEREPVVLTLSGSDRALVTAGPAALGVLLALVLPPAARWLVDLGIGLPFGVVFRVLGRVDTWWEIVIQAVLLGALGMLATAEILRRAVRITVGETQVRLEADGTPRTLARSEIAALYREGDALVVLDRESRQVFRGEPGARAALLEHTFREFGYPWHDEDPFAALYHRWVPETGLLPIAAEAVLRARAVALRKNAGSEARELRETIEELGYAVRDEGDQQFWRPLVRSDQPGEPGRFDEPGGCDEPSRS